MYTWRLAVKTSNSVTFPYLVRTTLIGKFKNEMTKTITKKVL